jgi:hypothetical protein
MVPEVLQGGQGVVASREEAEKTTAEKTKNLTSGKGNPTLAVLAQHGDARLSKKVRTFENGVDHERNNALEKESA